MSLPSTDEQLQREFNRWVTRDDTQGPALYDAFVAGWNARVEPEMICGGDSLDHSGATVPSDVRIVGTVSPLGSVTLTGEEFLALSAKEKQLTEALAQADAINGESVNQICALEAALTTARANAETTIATLAARVNRLRKRIGKAYDELAGASSEDAMGAGSDHDVGGKPDV